MFKRQPSGATFYGDGLNERSVRDEVKEMAEQC